MWNLKYDIAPLAPFMIFQHFMYKITTAPTNKTMYIVNKGFALFLLSKLEISSIWSSSVAVQTGLCSTWFSSDTVYDQVIQAVA